MLNQFITCFIPKSFLSYCHSKSQPLVLSMGTNMLDLLQIFLLVCGYGSLSITVDKLCVLADLTGIFNKNVVLYMFASSSGLI